jgi:hypothetical protein
MEELKEKNKNKRKIIAVISLLIIIVSLCIFLYSSLIDMMSLFETKEVEAFIIVSDASGVAINGTALMFGMVVPGGTSKKSVDLKNEHDGLAKVKIYAKGDIKDFINVSDNNFILYPNETKTVEFKVKIPRDTPFGNYTGKVIFEIRNAIVK